MHEKVAFFFQDRQHRIQEMIINFQSFVIDYFASSLQVFVLEGEQGHFESWFILYFQNFLHQINQSGSDLKLNFLVHIGLVFVALGQELVAVL